jgi:transcriptional regulator with XRE-family HTH domain
VATRDRREAQRVQRGASRRRSAAGLSLGRLAESVHVNRSYLYRVETGERWPTEPVARLLDDALHAHGAVFRLWEAGETARREEASNAKSVVTSLRDSHTLDALLADVPLGEAVTTAEKAAAALAVDYLANPPGPMLRAALDARRAVVGELRRAPSTAQRRDVIRAAGYLSGVLAYATLDLNHPSAASEHAATAMRCAESARDRELAAWVRGTQSLIARFEKDFPTALALAQDGLRVAGPGTSTPRLLAGVAQSAANLGDRAEAHRALNAAEAAANDAGRDSLPGLFTFSRAKLSYYGGSALMWLPEKSDSRRAADSAESAIVQWQTGDPADRSLDDEALAHVYAGTAYVRLGELDAAASALAPVLTLPTERRISWLRRRVGEITALLDDGRFAASVVAAELRSAVSAF